MWETDRLDPFFYTGSADLSYRPGESFCRPDPLGACGTNVIQDGRTDLDDCSHIGEPFRSHRL
mgnify:CR=1 FL=1